MEKHKAKAQGLGVKVPLNAREGESAGTAGTAGTAVSGSLKEALILPCASALEVPTPWCASYGRKS